MNRRAFIQGLIGLASMPVLSKYINVFRPSAVREGITQAADNTMSKGIEFYEAVIKRVMDEGTVVGESDRVRTYKHPDKPDINVELNVGTGDTAVYFETDMGSRAGAEITTDIEMPRAGKELMESEEVYRMGGDEYYKDINEEITGGVGSLEDWIKMKRGYAAGGRVGMWRGGMPKGLWAAIRSIWNKYGEDAITTANEIKRPKGVVEAEETAQAIKDFNLRNPQADEVVVDGEVFKKADKDRPPTEEEFEEYASILDPTGEAGIDAITIRQLDEAVADHYAYVDDMYQRYKRGDLEKYAPSLADEVNDYQIRAAVDDIFPTGDYKYDAQMAAEALVENNPQIFGNKLYEDLDQRTQSKIYGLVLEVVQGDMGKMLLMKRASKPTKTLEGIEKTGTINISDPNVAEEFARFMRETDPKGAKKVDEIVELINFDPKGRKKNAKGGHIKDDADVSLTIIEIPDISESGVESLFKRR